MLELLVTIEIKLTRKKILAEHILPGGPFFCFPMCVCVLNPQKVSVIIISTTEMKKGKSVKVRVIYPRLQTK